MEKMSVRIRELRLEKNLTQKQLAETLNTTDDSIFSWEKGRSQPSYEILIKFADFFNVSTDYLLGRTDELGSVVMPGAMQLTDQERGLILRYRQLRPDLQELLLSTAKTWADAPASERNNKT